jgi:hypothetical protein
LGGNGGGSGIGAEPSNFQGGGSGIGAEPSNFQGGGSGIGAEPSKLHGGGSGIGAEPSKLHGGGSGIGAEPSKLHGGGSGIGAEPSKLLTPCVTIEACEAGTIASAITNGNSQAIFFFMKFSSDELVMGFATTAKVVEGIGFQSAGRNLLRIRSTGDLQRSFRRGAYLEQNCGLVHFRGMAFSVRGAGEILLGILLLGKPPVTYKQTQRNIRIEFPAGSLLLV